MAFPELQTARLALTEIVSADSADVFELFSSDQVTAHYDLDTFTSLARADGFIRRVERQYQSGQGIRWAIRPRESSKLIGTCGFTAWAPRMRSGALVYELNERYWKNGYMLEALREVLRCAYLGTLPCGPMNRIEAETLIDNTRSQAVLERLGFTQESIRREAVFWRNAYHDMKCYVLLKREYEQAQS